MPERPIDIVRRIYDGWGRGDFDTGLELYDPYIVLVLRADFPDSGAYVGAEAIARYMREDFLGHFEDARIEGEEFIDAGDTVVVRIRQSAIGPGSRAPVEMGYYNVWTLRGGRIIRIESIKERGDALAAAGLPST